MRYISTFILSLSLLLISTGLKAQNNVGIGTNTPNASALLDLDDNTHKKGFLVPRMNGQQRSLISNPAEGLMVYDTDSSCFYFFKSGAWASLCNGGTAVQQTFGRWDTTGTTDLTYTPGSVGAYVPVKDMAITLTPTKSVVYVSASVSGDVVFNGTDPATKNDVSIVDIRLKNNNQVIAGGQSIGSATWLNTDSAFYVAPVITVINTTTSTTYDSVLISDKKLLHPISDGQGAAAWNITITKAVHVTPGIPVTLSLDWTAVFGGFKAATLRCLATTDKDGSARNMMVWE